MAVKGKHKVRIAITLAAYALAGLVTTLGIAWGWGGWSSANGVKLCAPSDYPKWDDVPSTAKVIVYRRQGWLDSSYGRSVVQPMASSASAPVAPLDLDALASTLRSLHYEVWTDSWSIPETDSVFSYFDASFSGFPFRCVSAWLSVDGGSDRPRVIKFSWFDLAAKAGWKRHPKWVFLVTPVWTGLIANTAFWGLVWYAMLFLPLRYLPSPLRLLPWSAASRKRRGLCIACGYDLTGATGRCPECGLEAAAATVRRV